MRVVYRLHEELANALTQGDHDLSAMQTQGDAGRDMLHSPVHDLTRVQLLLDAKRQKLQNFECVGTYL